MTQKITSFFPQSRPKNINREKTLSKTPLAIKKVLSKTPPTTVKHECLEEIENIKPLENISKAAVVLLQNVSQAVEIPVNKKRKWEISEEIHDPNQYMKYTGMVSKTSLKNGAIGKRRVELPMQYLKLEKMFSALESTITFMKSRDQSIVFHRIQRAVQGMCNSNFELKHLGQMIYLVPGLFHLEPIKIMHLGVKKDSLVFITDSNASNATVGDKVVFGGTAANIPKFENNTNVIKQAEQLTNNLYERKKTFHDALVKEALLGYNKYLVSIGEKEVDTLPSRWHSGYDEKSMPEIPSAELPINIVKNELIEDKKEQISGDSSSVQCNLDIKPAESAPQNPCASEKPKSKAAQLLERIKEKERKKKETVVCRQDPATLREKSMLKRMPELIQSIKLLYAKENRSLILMYKVCNHLSNSMIKSPISKDEALDHIKLLCKIAPNFVSIFTTDSGTSLKMNQVKFEDIEKTLQEYSKNVF